MKAVTIHDAKTNLSKYIAAAKRGEKVYIGSFGSAEVVLQAVPKPAKTQRRRFGVGKDKLWVADDAFSPDADAQIAREMYGEDS
jgi:antitoxin (DNA-binding transcriptional repressor) of toxin-antitoxin stability system